MSALSRSFLPWALLLAIVLHLPAHVGFLSESRTRTPLHEDGPALTANPALAPFGTETFGDVARRAVTDPQSVWSEGDGGVGRSRWTPVTQAAFALERTTFGTRTAVGAGVVSLLLHLAVVALASSVFAATALPRGAQALALALVAATPTALVAAAWPARQGIVLAAVLGLAGVRTALAGGVGRASVGGVLLALAGLAHPAGFGFAIAAVTLRRSQDPGPPVRATLAATVLPPVAAAAFAAWFTAQMASGLTEVPAASALGRSPGPLDGAVGMLHALASFLVPARLHVADGPWTAGPLAHAAAVAVLLACGVAAARRTATSPAASYVLGGLGALAPLLAVQGRSPVHEGVLYLATPFLAGAAGSVVARAVSRGGAVRTAAAVAGALLVGATLAGAASRASAFRTREGLLALALLETPSSVVVAAWDLDAAVVAAASSGRVPPDALRALQPQVQSLAGRVLDPAAVPLRADAVAATTVATALSRYAVAVAQSGASAGDPLFDAARLAADGARDAVPRWTRTWLVLAVAAEGQGALIRALDAAIIAIASRPDDLEALTVGTRIALAIGHVELAAQLAEDMHAAETAARRASGQRPRPEIRLLRARALAADGSTRAPDPFGGPGYRFRFEGAIAELEELAAVPELKDEVRRRLHDAYFHYGDMLASEDRPALATLAYRRAVEIAGDRGEAAEHAMWLQRRLRAEEAEASEQVRRASQGEGNLADAMVALATAIARQARFEEAAEIFAGLERDLGMPSTLRFHRAMQLYRESDPGKAAAELEIVVREAPELARAHFELAQIREERGDLEGALAAYDSAVRRFHEDAATTGAEEWGIAAMRRAEALGRILLREDSR